MVKFPFAYDKPNCLSGHSWLFFSFKHFKFKLVVLLWSELFCIFFCKKLGRNGFQFIDRRVLKLWVDCLPKDVNVTLYKISVFTQTFVEVFIYKIDFACLIRSKVRFISGVEFSKYFVFSFYLINVQLLPFNFLLSLEHFLFSLIQIIFDYL